MKLFGPLYSDIECMMLRFTRTNSASITRYIFEMRTVSLRGWQTQCVIETCDFRQEWAASSHLLQFRMGDWSSGMIPALGAGGRGFNSRISSIFKKLQRLWLSTGRHPSH
ncbi:Hypothetical_protein [Hexamita inflata]|uniref:Hypothetical_protein n=1 Tax=Hexamita inflata TaxID=28002 RepID=A0AA86VBN7_9EUKA|nr:Hypothetical protein HINF_LOCUS49798 [Hexamita inflata]CAI9962158.1 Hypothetical protein HINF_LOCUS49803 [Hexamita inflata]